MDNLEVIKFEEVEFSELLITEQLDIPQIPVNPLCDHDYVSLFDPPSYKNKQPKIVIKKAQQKEKLVPAKKIVKQKKPSTVIYDCKLCKYKTLSKEVMETHRAVHKTIKPSTKYVACMKCCLNPKELGYVVCDICGYFTKSVVNLKIHRVKVHVTKETYKCTHSYCNFYGKSLKDLIQHYKEHKTVENFECVACDFKTKSMVDLKSHHTTHIESMCKICFHMAESKADLTFHLREHGIFEVEYVNNNIELL